MQADKRVNLLENHFRQVQTTSMQDVPILNRQLQVQAVDFQAIPQGQLGVMVTPWFMNLIWLPEPALDTTAPAHTWLELPSGQYEFQLTQAANVGHFYACSLFSPMQPFADQHTTVLTAQQVMHTLLQPPTTPIAATKPSLSRRDFLRGKLT